MKILLGLVSAALVLSCNASAIPLDIPLDNSHYIEGESRYIWIPDGEGQPHLVDLQEPVDLSVFMRRDGAKNEYWLYTRQNPNVSQILVHNDIDSVANSNYDSSRGTVVIAHGWMNNGESELNPAITAAFLEVMDVNVIVLDWNDLAHSGYITATFGVPGVGEYLGDFLLWLFETAGGDFDQLHLVGHSLGAHIVGNAGRRIDGKARRVTGMDPAGPLWGGNDDALDVNSGIYVECIHTDGGFLGINDDICQVNFYPNGGDHPQPGCILSTCSHSRSHQLFASSVLRPDHFVGKQCDTLSDARNTNCDGPELYMGNGDINKNGSGWYSLTTESEYPY